jgi:hypothetical protein
MTRLVLAATVAWLGLWFHDAREFPGSLGLTADSIGMGVAAAALVLVAWRAEQAQGPYVALAGYGTLMLIGGALSVLPLPIWPFVPPQTLSHYLAHAVFAAAQVPLIVLSARRLRSAHVIHADRTGQ